MDIWGFVAAIHAELLLFCAFFFLLGALDDAAFDLFYAWNRLTGRLPKRVPLAELARAERLDGPVAVFVPAWHEAAVIGGTIDRIVALWAGEDYRLFVGCYPNDPETLAELRAAIARHPQIRLAINAHNGPTTKGDCLNTLWAAMLATEAREESRHCAVLLHDAEDIVHPAEIAVHRHYLVRYQLSQLPVLPIVPATSRWLAGHYADEFAEGHGKELRVRQSIGAALPSAGVGCAFRRDYLDQAGATHADGSPFPSGSLVEDYELGLVMSELPAAVNTAGGEAGGTLPLVVDAGGALVATRAIFPSTLDSVVRQKARWIAGIALAGWDRLGWRPSLAECWMRLHDRRSIFAAFVIALSYLLFALSLGVMAIDALSPRDLFDPAAHWRPLVFICLVNLVWRMTVRASFVAAVQGRRQALRSVPRTFIANVVAIMASWRAVVLYARHCLGQPLRWDKTDHVAAEGTGR